MEQSKITLYGSRGAPNPRRVEVFLAEKGLREAEHYEFVQVDMMKGEHKPGGSFESPNKKLPFIKVGDKVLGESIAICRFVEESGYGDEAKQLFGRDPMERAQIEFWNRRIELELLMTAVGKAWINGPIVGAMMEKLGVVTHESELELGKRKAIGFCREMNKELASRPYVVGEKFSVADITLLCVLDFAAGPVQIDVSWSKWPHLAAWHRRVSGRESVRIHKNPYISGKPTYEDGTDNSQVHALL
mmetsp:Transcript_15004/g.18565  ORF Transcript_15004/g.18565 Transcript_15004/m.18565 type:complete len:245 (-) Transcript_15004:276-1010(-)|eukprot:CAMPEP_0204877702 /NCGR_PEP_ID=MMETSP1348-20121228/48339_1 /ASSEMBLY_ACC=CAM_ASM_000700 /TAXON_ID=215587 /ORGANISM="Aplanochytrium stocchinoi, Strain GSBS06" /LENGTH=244 /DNA_ID=CAMNT_0052034603 /DNA_START=448 /DNA_END=1182 /DNA_ORIENTATION=-